MTVVPASSLSRAEMWMLGNNVTPKCTKDRRNRSAGCEAPAGTHAAAGSTPDRAQSDSGETA